MVETKLQEIRRRLLDLTRRNRLLNHQAKGQSTLEIVDELAGQVYGVLVDEARTMQFLSREEAPEEKRGGKGERGGGGEGETLGRADTGTRGGEREEAPREPLTNETKPAGVKESGNGIHSDLPLAPVGKVGVSERQQDRNLQTALGGEKLQTRLVHLAREAASALQEQGYNILYLTLGMVEWKEVEGEAVTSRAPLVFVPVELKRKTVNTRYSVQLFEDDVVTNPCLLELCRSQYGFELPVFDGVEGEIDAYFGQVIKAIEGVPGWRFAPEIHLGLFSFAKLLMYRDLDPASWPEPARLTGHPLICQLTGWVNGEDGAAAGGEGLPDPATLDDVIAPADCFQVVDADSSQQAAIVAAKRGVSMVIDGPPGTGKSQTITNIIGECLADGKTVLFVSEKAAALEVVKRRLEGVGLGDFVLELHSRKTSKKAVMQELQRTLDAQLSTRATSDQTAAELKVSRDALNSYRRELHEPWGGMGISPFAAISRAVAMAGEPEVVCEVPGIGGWTAEQFTSALARVESLDKRLARVGEPSMHPWRGAGLASVGLKEQQRIRKAAEELVKGIGGAVEAGQRLAERLGISTDASQSLGTGCKPASRESGSTTALTPARSRAVADSARCSRAVADSARCSRPVGNSAPFSREERAKMWSRAGIGELIETAGALVAMPAVSGEAIGDARWDELDPKLLEWIELGKRRAGLKAAWGAVVKPEAELEEWQPLLNRRVAQGRSFSRFFNPTWHADSRRLLTFTLSGKLPDLGAQISLLKDLIESARLRRKVDQESFAWNDQLGPAWQGVEGDWAALEKYVRAASAVRTLLNVGKVSLPAALAIVPSSDRKDLSREHDAAKDAVGKLDAVWGNWLEAIAGDDKRWLGTDWESAELPAVAERIETLPRQMEKLADWVDFYQLTRELSNGPLASFAGFLQSPGAEGVRGRAASAFARHFYRLWVEEALAERASLRGFRGQDHESLIGRFRELDRKWIEQTRHRLAARLAAQRPGHQAAHKQSKLGLLQAEFRKKARHMPLRKVLAAAGEVVQSIKPCFMMSPMSVAQYLAPGGLEFDVVIFDEASQVEPADAYGAVARGNQLLLVGDERQLPPTDFFSRADRDDPDPADVEEIRPADLESVLSLGVVRLPHRCGLRWHYRSRHSSLIEFSNQKFYDGALRVFPSPHTDCSTMGVSFRFVGNAVYNRGAGRYNAVEAHAVARAVIEHAIANPELSLGVGTLNQPQQKAIEDEIEHLRRTETDERVEAFIAAHAGKEPFFVKNLENIQGDERDVIFLSVGFGKDAAGKMSLNFGALNDEGGWRRLNVLVTRARRRCIVFSSIRHDDINLAGTGSRGVAALKDYLYAAEHGRLKDQPVPGKDHDSEFEAAVCRALRDRGWEVHPQVGCAGFAIDLAVVDPRAPGRYLLGIECDGATYHSSPTARDRDRLRQAVLEGLGWEIFRVWSTDWFHRPATVLEKLVARLEQLKRQAVEAPTVSETPVEAALGERRSFPVGDMGTSHTPGAEAEKIVHPTSDKDAFPTKNGNAPPADSGEPTGVTPYVHHRDAAPRGNADDLMRLATETLAGVLKELVDVEGPIHEEEAARAVAEMYQARVSPRMREGFDLAVEHVIDFGLVRKCGEFLWPGEEGEVVVRSRGEGCPVTRAELIAPEELESAVLLALRQQYGLKAEAAVESTARLLGYARTGVKLKAVIEQSIQRLEERGEIKLDAADYVTLNRE